MNQIQHLQRYRSNQKALQYTNPENNEKVNGNKVLVYTF